MSYKLEYPYTEDERLEFIIEYNHNQGLKIETVERAILTEELSELVVDYYALEANEIMVDNEPVIDPDYEAKQEQKERERIALLKLTKREVFLGLYQAKGVTPEQIKAQITDPAALIEFEYANDYYRGNPLIDIVGSALGITSEQLDKFFETNDYTYLISEPDVDNSEVTAEENSVVNDVTELEDVNNSDGDVDNQEVGETV